MSYTVTLDNGMTGSVDKTLYDVIISTIVGGVSGMIAGKLTFDMFNKYFPNSYDKENKQYEQYTQQPVYEQLCIYMDDLPEEDKPVDLGERMKLYEEFTEYTVSNIDAKTSFVIRIDGRCFSNILNKLKQNEIEELNTPFISDFMSAMQLTTRDLVKEFNASTGYTHSDEISLYFRALNSPYDDEEDIKEHLFGGRVQKLTSLIASCASTRLIKHLTNINNKKFESILERISFDGRAIVFPSLFEICNYFLWRSKQDCFRNFVSELCYMYFPKKSLEKLNVDERITKLRNEKRIDVEDYNIFLRRGTFVKRELEHYQVDEKNYWRNTYVKFALPELKCNDDYVELFECKNFEQWEMRDIEFELTNYF